MNSKREEHRINLQFQIIKQSKFIVFIDRLNIQLELTIEWQLKCRNMLSSSFRGRLVSSWTRGVMGGGRVRYVTCRAADILTHQLETKNGDKSKW